MVMSGSGPGVARLACFELWGGNSMVAHPIELPGLVGWLSSMPFGQAASGGDVHYLSCAARGRYRALRWRTWPATGNRPAL